MVREAQEERKKEKKVKKAGVKRHGSSQQQVQVRDEAREGWVYVPQQLMGIFSKYVMKV